MSTPEPDEEIDAYYELDELPFPAWIKDAFQARKTLKVVHLSAISELGDGLAQHAYSLLLRHALTDKLARHGLHPPLLLYRARVYELLGNYELQAADAFVAYTLCESVRSEEWISDLEPLELSGEPWAQGVDGKDTNMGYLLESLSMLCETLVALGAMHDARDKFDEYVERYNERMGTTKEADEIWSSSIDSSGRLKRIFDVEFVDIQRVDRTGQYQPGQSRRVLYDWETQLPYRQSTESLEEMNILLSRVAPNLRVKGTSLPDLQGPELGYEGFWHQLGLFAAKPISPGIEILREKSLITAIRPLDDALCEACGANLESVSRIDLRECPGVDCDTTYCSEDCASRASSEYHRPNTAQNLGDHEDSDRDEDHDTEPEYPPAHAPFCGNTALNEIGRTTSTNTAEWDLYFLLLARTMQTAITQTVHPLSLPAIKYLWGDFCNSISDGQTPDTTLPWSLHHNLTLPLQFFETLMHSVPEMKPYSKFWLENYDWWVQTILYAKLRGVANAQQSTFDGKAEIAAVHPMWCLANHSCEPNVTWTPTGERVFKVRDQDELVVANEDWKGIQEGEEIFSHYTDVRLPVNERQDRLREVLGGACQCPRCLRET